LYITRDVELPEPLLAAQSSGDLLVFAGAGVSMGAPSDLPNFVRLAEQILKRALSDDEASRLDNTLGVSGMSQEALELECRRILDRPGSAPTGLHTGILGLFTGPDTVRVVTTNYDKHFTTAAVRAFPEPVREYVGPALPLGRDFSGIVHLHGSLDAPEHPLILTDVGFGQAYLTDAWASRFLRDAFSRYTVLFVGYSHADFVMEYLSRGLTREGPGRFAMMVEDEDPGPWRARGIRPVGYAPRLGPDRHAALTEAIESWAERESWGLLDHDARIRDLVTERPSENPAEVDYLREMLSDPAPVRSFVEHATEFRDTAHATEWLNWVAAHGFLDEAFSPLARQLAPEAYSVAAWFAREFAVGHAQAALDVVVDRGGRVGAPLARLLLSALHDSSPSPGTLGAWISVVAASVRAESVRPITRVFPEKFESGYAPAFEVLLRWLTAPILSPRKPFFTGDEITLRTEVDLPIDHYQFRELKLQVIDPNLGELAARVLDVADGNLREAFAIAGAADVTAPGRDPINARRSAIEPHPQDRYPEAIDVLIDLARDCLCWLVGHRPDVGLHRAHLYAADRSPLIRRLGIHALGQCAELDPDELLQLVEDRGWLFSLDEHHEVFLLLATAFPEASQGSQERLLTQVETARLPIERDLQSGTVAEEFVDRVPEIAHAARFNVAHWLSQSAPDSAPVADLLARLQAGAPDLRPREHPDLLSWVGDVRTVHPTSPISADALLGDDPESHIETLRTFVRQGIEGPSRDGLLPVVSEAFARDPARALRLAEALVAAGSTEPDVWKALVTGLRTAQMDTPTWRSYLTLLSGLEILEQVGGSIVSLLEDALKGERFPYEAIESAEHMADTIRRVDGETSVVGESAITQALNYSAGCDALVLIHTLSARRQAAAQWEGLPAAYRARFEGLLNPRTDTERLGLAVLGSQVNFLYAIDPDWAKQSLLPVFASWPSQSARLVWEGFLTWGRWSPPVAAALLPAIPAVLERRGEFSESLQDQLVDRLAVLALQSQSSPLEGETPWLRDTITALPVPGRVQWHRTFGRLLKSLPSERIEAVWTAWLCSYLEDRALGRGVPRPSPEETAAVVPWLSAVGSRFSQAVEAILRWPPPSDGDGFVVYRLADESAIEAHPDSGADLLAHVFEGVENEFYHCDAAVALLDKLAAGGVERAKLLALVDRLAEIGCRAGARELRERL
jgi:hypothetical protein